jgi:hypothetical protein
MFQGMQSWFFFSFILIPMEEEERRRGCDTKLHVGGMEDTLARLTIDD